MSVIKPSKRYGAPVLVDLKNQKKGGKLSFTKKKRKEEDDYQDRINHGIVPPNLPDS